MAGQPTLLELIQWAANQKKPWNGGTPVGSSYGAPNPGTTQGSPYAPGARPSGELVPRGESSPVAQSPGYSNQGTRVGDPYTPGGELAKTGERGMTSFDPSVLVRSTGTSLIPAALYKQAEAMAEADKVLLSQRWAQGIKTMPSVKEKEDFYKTYFAKPDATNGGWGNEVAIKKATADATKSVGTLERIIKGAPEKIKTVFSNENKEGFFANFLEDMNKMYGTEKPKETPVVQTTPINDDITVSAALLTRLMQDAIAMPPPTKASPVPGVK